MISMEKKYRTRSGKPARVLCTDASDKCPVVALVDGVPVMYTAEGHHCANYSTDYSSDLDLIEVSQYDDFKVDDPVMVRLGNSGWCKRYFSRVSASGLPVTFIDGKTSWTAGKDETTRWYECRRPTPEELGVSK